MHWEVHETGGRGESNGRLNIRVLLMRYLHIWNPAFLMGFKVHIPGCLPTLRGHTKP